MKLHSILSLLLVCLLGTAAPLALKETDDSCIVTVDSVPYTIRKKLTPSWSGYTLVHIGDIKDRNGLSTLVSIDGEGHLLPNGGAGKSTFKVLEQTDDSIRIRMSFPMSRLDQRKELSESAEQIYYLSFAAGTPGFILESRVRCITDKIRVGLFSTSVSSDFDCYYNKDGQRTEYGKGNWANVGFKECTGEKASGRFFFYPTIGRLPGRGLTTHVCAQWTEKILALGETVSMKIAFGKVESYKDGEKLVAFYNAVRNPEEAPLEQAVETGLAGMNATPVKTPIAIGKFNGWDGIPLTVERNEAKDYRPSEANTWLGPHDLSFKAWAAFDQNNLYLRVNVRDNQVVQPETGGRIWAGDCIQIGIDPLCEKTLSPSQILFGVGPTSPKVTVCGWSHPNKDYMRDDLTDIISCACRIDKGGYECELAIPMEYLKPFELVRGKMGFNIVVLDGANHWMGITDGIAGGKVPGLYQDLTFRGMEDALFASQKAPKPELLLSSTIMPMDKKLQFNAFVYVNDSDLPAELCVDFPGTGKMRHPLVKGFNSFPCAFLPSELKRGKGKASVYLMSNGKAAYQHDYDIVLADKAYVLDLAKALDAKADTLAASVNDVKAKTGHFPFYLSSRAWIAKYYASRARMLADVAPAGSEKEKLYYSTLTRNMRNLLYCDAMLTQGFAEAKDMLAGKLPVLDVPVPPKGVRPLPTDDGGFAIGDQEYLFLGGNTWGLAQENYLEYIAGSGLNFFNMFNLKPTHDAWSDMTKQAEDLGLFFNRRTCMQKYGAGHYFFTAELNSAPFVAIEESSPNMYQGKSTPWTEPSPNLLYVIGHEEGAAVPIMRGKSTYTKDDITAEYKRIFVAHLKKRYKTLEALNARTGRSFASFEDAATYDKGADCSPLRYDHYLCFRDELNQITRNCAWNLSRLWQRPVSTHISSLVFDTYDTLALIGNLDDHWDAFALPGFDGGLGCVHKEFAMAFSGASAMLMDLSRSLYPKKTAVNNEEYLISCSTPSAEPPEIYHYTSALYPALHGRTASSIFVFDNSFTSKWGELTFRRAEGFYQTARAALDMRRLANDIAPFRNLQGPGAILYTMSGYLDRKYPARMHLAWEGMSFSGLPVKFISERQIAEGRLDDFKVLAVNAKHLEDSLFDTLMAYADRGSIILCQGDDAMMFNECGLKVPARAERMAKRVTRVSADFTRAWNSAYENALDRLNIKPPIQVTGPDGRHIYGLEYRCATSRRGKDLMYLVNVGKSQVLAGIAGKQTWTDLISGKKVTFPITVNSLDVLLLEADK